MDYYDEVVEITGTRAPNTSSIDMTERAAGLAGGVLAENTNRIAAVTNKSQGGDGGKPPQELAFVKLPDTTAEAKGPRSHALTDDSNDGSETEESSESAVNNGPPAFVVDHKEWDKLDVTPEMKELFQFTLRYSPSKVHIDYVLQPFIPEFIPAVGDIDAFLKVTPPQHNESRAVSEFLAKLGVETLDEPSQQSEPALLHMKLRSMTTLIGVGVGRDGSSGAASTPGSRGTGAGSNKLPLVPVARQTKDVDKWIHEIQQLHMSRQPYALVQQQQQQRKAADIDALMNEWPPELERALGTMGFPRPYLDCTLETYVLLVCGLLDISVPAVATQADYIFALNTLFNLYMAVRQK